MTNPLISPTGSDAGAGGNSLVPIVGPSTAPIALDSVRPLVTVGRGDAVNINLPAQTVSRRHAMLALRDGQWFVSDLGSAHGTYVNGVAVKPESPVPLERGDVIKVGPWLFEFGRTGGAGVNTAGTDDDANRGFRLERPITRGAAVASHRLQVLMQLASAINTAADVRQLAYAVVRAAVHGGGFPRGALLRARADCEEVEILSAVSSDGGRDNAITFSRSLIRASCAGAPVRLWPNKGRPNSAESIERLGIHTAICVPVVAEDVVVAHLYLDARADEPSQSEDVVAFCEAIAGMAGPAIAGLKTAELRERQREILASLEALRSTQRALLPSPHGRLGRVEYAMRIRYGSIAGGDLFDVMPLGDRRTAVVLGDVSGHTIDTSVLMAAIMSFLRAELPKPQGVAAAVRAANEFLSPRISDGRFVSLWAGVIDADADAVEFVDAGHGHWAVVGGAGVSESQRLGGGCVPIGIDPGMPYHAQTLELPPKSRLILYSDGVIEQPDFNGEEFGLGRLNELLTAQTGPAEDVDAVLRALERHAGRVSLADDTTIASITLRPA